MYYNNNQQKPAFVPSVRNGKSNNKKQNSTENYATMMIEPYDFDYHKASRTFSLKEICTMINRDFDSVISGYEGCLCKVAQVRDNIDKNKVDLILTFEIYVKDVKGEDDKLKIIEFPNLNKESGNNGYDRLKSVEAKFNTKLNRYHLTEKGKEVLSEFRFGQRTVKGNWDVIETNNNGIITICVSGLSVEKFINKHFKSTKNKTTQDGKTKVVKNREYKVILTSSIMPGSTASMVNYVVSVEQYNLDAINSIRSEMGLSQPTLNGLNIITNK